MPGTEYITKCGVCRKKADQSFKTGRHCMTGCQRGHRVRTHNNLRDVIHQMYRALGATAEKEVLGLFSQLSRSNEYRPADVLVPPSATGGALHQALDIAITDPTNKTNLQKHTDRIPLKAAAEAHKRKMDNYQKQLEQAGQAGLQFTKTPLAFETTGAMGAETQKWWKGVLELAKERDPIRQIADSTWTAKKFAPYYLQLISMTQARSNAEAVVAWMGKSRSPTDYDNANLTEHV